MYLNSKIKQRIKKIRGLDLELISTNGHMEKFKLMRFLNDGLSYFPM